VIRRIGPEVTAIYVVDDACPEASGQLVETEINDPRIHIIRHPSNRGVGAATMTGMMAALTDGVEILVKLDGDGQMDPAFIPRLVDPIVRGQADYTKGNRFYAPEGLKDMPTIRLLGNAAFVRVADFSVRRIDWHVRMDRLRSGRHLCQRWHRHAGGIASYNGLSVAAVLSRL
jgi:glycosyltransferase involved in cell wall biosynthesis